MSQHMETGGRANNTTDLVEHAVRFEIREEDAHLIDASFCVGVRHESSIGLEHIEKFPAACTK